MKLIVVLASLLIGGCASAAGIEPAPAAIFAGLSDSCWRAGLADGNSDTHCFSSAVGGKLTMDVHKVRNPAGAVIYEGVTVYRLEAGGVWAYDYSNAFGSITKGYARREADTVRFFATPDAIAAETTRWQVSRQGYDVKAGADATRFRRVGPAGAGGLGAP